jgi:ATP-dependent Zn protease
VLDSRLGDVMRQREDQRRRRLIRVAVLLGPPTAYLWYRILDDRGVNLFQVPEINWLVMAPVMFFVALILILVFSQVASGRSPHVLLRPEQIDVRLSDVVGIDVVRDEVVRSLNLFLAHQTFADEMGGRPRRGILFEGSPGTGKTHTAKAMAAEAGVPFLYASGTSFTSSLQGATSRKVRQYFKELRKAAQKEGGAIGFIDEFDALGASRSGMHAMTAAPASTSDGMLCCGGLEGLPGAPTTSPFAATATAGGTVTNGFTGSGDAGSGVMELLVQMQSFDQPTGGEKLVARLRNAANLFLPAHRQLRIKPVQRANILLIAATNRADALDPALLRPGRFDRKLTFDLPAKAARRDLIDHFLARKAHDGEMAGDERRDALAAVTQGYSPAMLEGLMDEALISAVRGQRTAMSWKDVEAARLSTSVGLGQPVAYTDHELRLIATHEAGHATVAWLLAPERRLEILTVIKRGGALGLLAHGDREDVYTRSRAEMTAHIAIAMGGQCAEEQFFGDVSTGPSSDLLYATNVAAQMVGACGMTGSLVSYAAVTGGGFGSTNIVGKVLGDPAGRAAVEGLLQEQKVAVRALLAEQHHLVEALRDALLDRHELVGHEITDVLEHAQSLVPDKVVDVRAVEAGRRHELPGLPG